MCSDVDDATISHSQLCLLKVIARQLRGKNLLWVFVFRHDLYPFVSRKEEIHDFGWKSNCAAIFRWKAI